MNMFANLIGGAMQSAFSALAARGQQKRQFEYQKQLQDHQNQFTEYMWNQNNAYNDPSAQLDRAMNAGINPNVAIGTMNGMGNASQVQGGSPGTAATGNPIDTPNLGQSFMQDQMMGAQIDLMKSEAERNRADADVKTQEAQWVDRLNTVTVDQISTQIKELESKINLNAEQAKQITEAVELLQRQNEREKLTFISDVNRVLQETANAVETGKLLKEQQKTEKTEQERNRTSAALDREQAKLVDEQKQSQNIENQRKQIELQFEQILADHGIPKPANGWPMMKMYVRKDLLSGVGSEVKVGNNLLGSAKVAAEIKGSREEYVEVNVPAPISILINAANANGADNFTQPKTPSKPKNFVEKLKTSPYTNIGIHRGSVWN